MRKHISLVVLALVVALAALIPAPGQAQGRQRCFSETGFCISGTILEYWERNGGLAVFGYPVADLRIETVEGTWTGPVQWFERDRLEDHSNEGKGILAGRMGARYLEMTNRPWETYPKATSAPNGCRFFAETGHSLCGKFLAYWQNNGGLARFGYPITEVVNEQIENWRGDVQYFERRRMELHPENAGTAYEVLLGLLAKNVRVIDSQANGCNGGFYNEMTIAVANAPFAQTLGCPGEGYSAVEAAAENFQSGKMIWVNLTNSGPSSTNRGKKIVVIYDHLAPTRVYGVSDDTWQEGEPESANLTPPAGLYEPRRGFGKLWRAGRGLGQFLGWATEPERGERATVQYTSNGGMVIWLQFENAVYVLGPDGNPVYEYRR